MKRNKVQKVHCYDCNKDFLTKKMQVVFPDIPHLFERLDVGGEVPAGECPKCSSLVYAVKEDKVVTGGSVGKQTARVVVLLEEGLVRGITSEIQLEVLVQDVDEKAKEKVVYTRWRPEEITVDPSAVKKTFMKVQRRR